MRACLVFASLLPVLLISACSSSQPPLVTTAPVPAPAPATTDATTAEPAPVERAETDPLTAELREPKLLNELPGEGAPSAPTSTEHAVRDGSIIIKGNQQGAMSDPP